MWYWLWDPAVSKVQKDSRKFSQKTDIGDQRKAGMLHFGGKTGKAVDHITCMIENILNEFEK